MKLELFFEKFDQFADAPDAVAKMRELVLDLAIQGKLVGLKASDGDGHSLLKKLRMLPPERNSKSRPPKDIVVEPETPLEIPSHWALTTVENTTRETGFFCDGDWVESKDQDPDGDVRLIQLADVGDGVYRDRSSRFMTEAAAKRLNCSYLEVGDILVARMPDPLGRCCRFYGDSKPAVTVVDVCILRPNVSFFDPDFLVVAINCPRFRRLVSAQATGTTRSRISRSNLGVLPIPLPPLAEQKRIVAKVDELMALCDRLEAQQHEREARYVVLNRASLARFADAPTQANLPFLFHPSYAIPPAALRKSILTLAVQGKLVPQDPNDDPADSILRQTHSFFDRLVTAKKLSDPKPLPPIEDDEVPFSLPIGWVWCRFGQIMRISSGDGLVAKDMNAGPIPVYGGNGVNGYHDAHNVAKRTLVIGRVGFYCGSIHVTPERAWVTDNAFITTFDEEHVDMNFLNWLLKATDLRERDNATAQPVISGGKVYPTVLAIPPLAEQRRIVAKVELLMALVDALETQLADSREKGQKLLEAVVGELTLAS